MTTLRDIRKRIQSVEHVEQITKAMEMVALARLHKAQIKAQQSMLYASKVKEVLNKIIENTSDLPPGLLFRPKIQKRGIVIVSADKGLCGSYNSNIMSNADGLLKKYPHNEVELILIGQKAISHYQHHPHWTIRHQVEEWGGKISPDEMKSLADQLLGWYLNHELDEIILIYNHFVSVFHRKVVQEKFLGFDKPEKTDKEKSNYIFEPDQKTVIDDLLPRYTYSIIQSVLDQSYASELASRAVSMRKATKNAEDMILRLTLVRNKVRQTGITREMIEIASGAEGLK